MSDNLPWKTWTPDDLAPPQAVYVPMVEPEESIPEEAAPNHEQQLAQLQMQAHEQGYQAGITEGRQQGHEQGYQEGIAQGLEQGLAQAKSQQAPIHARMQQLEAARQVIGQTPTVDNAALIKQIQQLLQQEPLFSGKPQLRVHPDDLQRIDEMLGATLGLHGWRLRGDPTLHPGGCKVSADEGELDASVATRWQELCRLAAPGVV